MRRKSEPPRSGDLEHGNIQLGVVLGIGLHRFLTARRPDDARTSTPRDPVRRRPIGERRGNSIALGPGPRDADGLVISRVLTPDGDMRDEDVSLWSRLSQMHHSRTRHEHLPPRRSDDSTHPSDGELPTEFRKTVDERQAAGGTFVGGQSCISHDGRVRAAPPRRRGSPGRTDRMSDEVASTLSQIHHSEVIVWTRALR